MYRTRRTRDDWGVMAAPHQWIVCCYRREAPALCRTGASRIHNARQGLDRYAARCVNFVLVVTRIAVPAARSAARETGNQSRARPEYQGPSP
jgi:hypothetical protein